MTLYKLYAYTNVSRRIEIMFVFVLWKVWSATKLLILIFNFENYPFLQKSREAESNFIIASFPQFCLHVYFMSWTAVLAKII